MAHSLLMIPVPELESVVRPRLVAQSPDLVGGEDDVAAHITLIAPFADFDDIDDGLLGELGSFFADVLPFAFQLTTLSQFPSGTTYLTPDPAAPFRTLTHVLMRRFPEYPPYQGQFSEVVPHLSVPLQAGETWEDLRDELAPRLPMTAYAREAALYWWEPGGCRTIETFPFGTSAA